ncbi:hypothetical protein OS175_02930 [Marinicella sp. S1101]|uniref:hypothetical protein n=1 Tax=Marinicella marina TaxID=2996016 RepID=UPI002260C1FE|nr:hypothetical protein [Marinicella marina]MCX7552822.1 hypothetical protein [Marinicella marina]MDJ1139869.1 hypothetical protein [Marinicella marina]
MSENKEVIHVVAGEKVEIYCRRFSGLPLTIEFGASAKNCNKSYGHIEIESFGLMLNQPNRTIALDAYNSIKVGFWDTFFRVLVKAECDLEVTLPQPQRAAGMNKFMVLAFSVVVFSAIIFVMI